MYVFILTAKSKEFTPKKENKFPNFRFSEFSFSILSYSINYHSHFVFYTMNQKVAFEVGFENFVFKTSNENFNFDSRRA